jgi:hypothetical protein
MMTSISAMSRRSQALLFAAAVVSLFAMLILGIWVVQSDAIDIAGMDMNVVYTIQKIVLGNPLYMPPDAAPFDISQYTPLYYVMVAALAKVFRASGDDPIAVTRIARAFSLVVAAGIALAVYRFARTRLGATARTSIIASAFIVAATSPWYFGARVDGLATLFSLTAIFLVLKSVDQSARRSDALFVVGILFGLASVMTKQSNIGGLVTIAVFLVSTRNWSRIGVAGAIIAVVALLVALTLPLLGSALRANLIDGVNNGITLRESLGLAYGPTFYWFAPLIAAALAVSWGWLTSRAAATERMVAIAVAVSFCLSMATAIKRGAAENYFNELIIFSTLAVVAGFFVPTDEPGIVSTLNSRITTAFFAYLIAFFGVRTAHEIYTTYLYHRSDVTTRLHSQKGPMHFVARTLEPGRTAIGFAVGLSNFLPERILLPQQEVAAISYWGKVFDYSRFRHAVETGNVQLVVVRKGERPVPWLGASFDDFVPLRQFRYYTVYTYRGPPQQRP